MAKRPTLADVAARSGLSKTAVSLILNERPGSRLSAEAVEKVRTAAADLGYRPNPAAQSLRMGKTRTIGFVSDEVTITRFASAMIRGVLDTADQHEHTVLISETGRESKRTASALDAMLDRRADGIIFGLMGAKQIDVPPVSPEVPVVLLNASSDTGESTVLPDEETAGHAIGRVLLDHGHRRVALLGDWPSAMVDPRVSATVALRFAGLDRAFAEFGAAPVYRGTIVPWEPAPAYEAAVALLDSGVEFTAAICLNDRIAFALYQALQERGLRIPDDVSVVSFDDDEIADYLRPGLTTARIPYEQMGRDAVEILLGGGVPQHRLVPMPLIERQSVRAVP
ncbi:LacI family transcriptional regulator [Rathayibacter sp. PhB151]|uniref:LacI family DNA-binding transcriptional regulator n=1 Tax=Rathayibacter sp. PhB151 TaxID=2485189 RepID=UPI001063B36B|nr:LacI family DNA-binding transcriptional regulator [Rathayibacter sp. PhB151]TDX81679.1 LacI family transcriptional regulator [Rathayibacter sp. PhB151]